MQPAQLATLPDCKVRCKLQKSRRQNWLLAVGNSQLQALLCRGQVKHSCTFSWSANILSGKLLASAEHGPPRPPTHDTNDLKDVPEGIPDDETPENYEDDANEFDGKSAHTYHRQNVVLSLQYAYQLKLYCSILQQMPCVMHNQPC